ncbi:hypothetical protein N1851_032665 [Merluccius polli]|uniref:Nuclease HARBI1 n=1 Tax=Merluccius polli TaxID=89951 RepID=A0AA47M2N2_MERPO|nr:hypothetical protein N1851_032665 [Merluccius polli]
MPPLPEEQRSHISAILDLENGAGAVEDKTALLSCRACGDLGPHVQRLHTHNVVYVLFHARIQMYETPVLLELCAELRPALEHNTARSQGLSVPTQVLTTLGFLATGAFQWELADRSGVCQSTLSRAMPAVRDGIIRMSSRSGGVLLYRPEKVCHIVMACGVLHNVAHRHGIPLPEQNIPPPEEPDAGPINFNPPREAIRAWQNDRSGEDTASRADVSSWRGDAAASGAGGDARAVDIFVELDLQRVHDHYSCRRQNHKLLLMEDLMTLCALKERPRLPAVDGWSPPFLWEPPKTATPPRTTQRGPHSSLTQLRGRGKRLQREIHKHGGEICSRAAEGGHSCPGKATKSQSVSVININYDDTVCS